MLRLIYKIISDENIKPMVKKEKDYMLALREYDRELLCIIQFLVRAGKARFLFFSIYELLFKAE